MLWAMRAQTINAQLADSVAGRNSHCLNATLQLLDHVLLIAALVGELDRLAPTLVGEV